MNNIKTTIVSAFIANANNRTDRSVDRYLEYGKILMDVPVHKIILIDDTIIEIKAYADPKPKIEMLIQLLIYVCLARRKNIIINKIQLYNPIHGQLYTWDIREWNKQNELLDFIYKKI